MGPFSVCSNGQIFQDIPREAAGVVTIGNFVGPLATRTGLSAADFGDNRKPVRDSVRGGNPIRVKAPGSSISLAGEEGLEPPTPGFGDRCSNQLSYTPAGNFSGSAIALLEQSYGAFLIYQRGALGARLPSHGELFQSSKSCAGVAIRSIPLVSVDVSLDLERFPLL
jgi:hypothetical protein